MAETRNASYARNLRASYARYLIKAVDNPNGDYDYNPVLDDPHSPCNPRGLTHGMLDGYKIAKCKCPPCADASRQAKNREIDNKITNHKASHQARITVFLTRALPEVAGSDAAEGAAAVMSTCRVTDRYRAVLAYDHTEVRKALRRWGAPDLLSLDDDTLTDLVTSLISELSS